MMNLEAHQPVQSTTAPIPLGDPGTAATIARMRGLIDQGMKHPMVHECAAFILRSQQVNQFDFAGEARAIYLWVLRSIRFTRDIAGKETLHSPEEILRLGIGDCDDFTILLCSLLGTIGHKTRIVTISSIPETVDSEQPFTHVYPEVWIGGMGGGRWVAVDAARREPAFGKNPRRYTRKRIWAMQSDEYVDVQGLNFYGTGYETPAKRFHDRARGGMSGYRGLGDVNFSTLVPQLIPEVTTGAANIITAERASPINLVPTTSQGGVPGGFPGTAFASPIASGSFGISTGMLLLLGLGAVVLFMGRR